MAGRRVLKARTIEQLSALKGLRTLDRFTMGRLAVTAGVRATTLRLLFMRWLRQGFPLLKEVGTERGAGAGQPPKVYMLAAEMWSTVDAAIAAADPQWTAATEVFPSAKPVAAIERLNVLDAATKMVARAGQAADPERRAELLSEGERLLERSRVLLRQREEAGRGVPSAELQRGLEAVKQQIAAVAGRLLRAVADRALEFQRRAEAYAVARERAATAPPLSAKRGEAIAGYQNVARESYDWLSTSAKHYLHTRPSGRGTEVEFFGALLVARGKMGDAQDTLFDEWLSKFMREDGDMWEELQQKFALAFGCMIDCDQSLETWVPVCDSALRGARRNARLAIVSTIHEQAARLISKSPSDALRQATHDFLQRYSTHSDLLRNAAAQAPPDAAGYFKAQARLSTTLPEETARQETAEQLGQAFEKALAA